MKKLVITLLIALSFFAHKAEALPVVTNGLALYYSFSGNKVNWTSASTGTITDESGSGNTGTINSGMRQATSPVAGKVGQGMSFSARTNQDYISFPEASYTKGTVCFWVKNTVDAIQVGDTNNNRQFRYGRAGSNVLSTYDGVVETISNTLTTPRGQWLYACYAFTGGTVTFYENGATRGSGTLTSTIINSVQNLLGGTAYPGNIDELAIYNRALSQSEITKLYLQGATNLQTSAQSSNYLTKGLVGYWTMNGSDTTWSSAFAGTETDKSGNGNTGTLTNMSQATSTVAGGIGQAMFFGGAQYVDAGTGSSLLGISGDVTISAWVKPTIIASKNQSVAGSFTSSNVGYWMRLENGFLTFYGVNNTGVASNTTAPVGKWTHLTAVRNGTNVLLYINGVLDKQQNPGAPVNPTSANHFRIAVRSDNSATDFFSGGIDEVRIYNRALSASEVNALYQMGAAKLETTAQNRNFLTNGLVHYFSMNGADTTWTSAFAGTETDLSGQGHTGTLTNMSQATSTVNGKIGQAFIFGLAKIATNFADEITFSGPTLTNTHTISAWINPRVSASTYGVIYTINNNQGLYYNASTKKLDFFGGGVGDAFNTTALTPNVWTHVIAACSAGTETFYINGALDRTVANGCIGFTPSRIGSDNGSTPESFIGTIDEVRVYSRALSAAEANALYLYGKSTFK